MSYQQPIAQTLEQRNGHAAPDTAPLAPEQKIVALDAESVATAKIRARIATLEKERDGFVENANRQIAAYGGAIEALRALLDGAA